MIIDETKSFRFFCIKPLPWCHHTTVSSYFFQGDGTAAIFATDEHVFTFSMHCGSNFPFAKQRSDVDVSLEAGTEVSSQVTRLYTSKIFPCLTCKIFYFSKYPKLYLSSKLIIRIFQRTLPKSTKSGSFTFSWPSGYVICNHLQGFRKPHMPHPAYTYGQFGLFCEHV